MEKATFIAQYPALAATQELGGMLRTSMEVPQLRAECANALKMLKRPSKRTGAYVRTIVASDAELNAPSIAVYERFLAVTQ